MPTKITLEVFNARLREHQGETISLHPDAIYEKIFQPIAHVCHVCGHGEDGNWIRYASDFKCGCPVCRFDKLAELNHHPRSDYIDRLAAVNDTVQLCDPEWSGVGKAYLHRCLVCNYGSAGEWKPSCFNLLKGSGCPICSINGAVAFQLGKRTVMLRGAEPAALKWLLANRHRANQIIVDKERTENGYKVVPNIPYVFGDKDRIYYPDFYVPSLNLLYEVKSTFTAGLSYKANYIRNRSIIWRTLKTKALACIESGYRFELLLFDGNKKIEVPDNWLNLSRKEMKHAIKRLAGNGDDCTRSIDRTP